MRTVEGAATEPRLPEPVDLIFVSASYHHIADPIAYFSSVRRELRPGGRVAVLERRRVGFARLLGHATDPGQIREELAQAGFRLAESHDFPAGTSFQEFARDGSAS